MCDMESFHQMVNLKSANHRELLAFIERNEPGWVALLRSVNKESHMAYMTIFASIFIFSS